MLKAVVGHSNDPDTEFAIAEVLEQCLTGLAGLKPQAAILLAALDFDHGKILHHIHQTFPDIQLIGGTTDSEISSILEFQQDSLVLMVLCSDFADIPPQSEVQLDFIPMEKSPPLALMG